MKLKTDSGCFAVFLGSILFIFVVYVAIMVIATRGSGGW